MKHLTIIFGIVAMLMAMTSCPGGNTGGEDPAQSPTVELTAAVDSGSQWTDGDNFYGVQRIGDTLRLTGGTLHEGGAIVDLLVTGDSTLKVLPLTQYHFDDYSMFAAVGSTVRHRIVGGHEVLVAIDSLGNAVDALVRFEGSGLEFTTRAIQQMLAGTYTLDGAQYVFTPDGKATVPGMATDAPYKLDLIYDMPNGSLDLGNDKHIAVQLVPEGIDVFQSVWDANEEAWMASELTGHAPADNTDDFGPMQVYKSQVMVGGVVELLSVPAASWLLDKVKAVENATPLQVLNQQLLDARLKKMQAGDD